MHKKRKTYVLLTLRECFVTSEDGKIRAVGVWEKYYYNRQELIRKLAISKVYDSNRIIDNLLANTSDTSVHVVDTLPNKGVYNFSYDSKRKYCLAKLVKNDIETFSYNIISKDVEKKVEELNIRRAKRLDKLKADRRSMKYTFRRGNVPGICKHRWHRGTYYRHPQLHRLMIQSANIEYKEFIKGKERMENLPTWDDRPRHNDKSWKTSFKCRKQWQKHQKH